MEEKYFEHTMVPNRLIDSTDFEYPIDKLLLICLLRYSGEDEPSMETLSQITGESEEVVNDSYSRLVDSGVIRINTNLMN